LTAYWLWAVTDARLFQSGMEQRLEQIAAGGRARWAHDGAAGARREATGSGLVGRIDIPRVGLSAIIVEGTDGRALRRGVGHVEGTAFPGERGNIGLAGHRDTYFRKLRGVAPGDRIRLWTPDGVFDYEVDSTLVVDPRRGDLLDDAGRDSATLTLVTCYPFRWVGPAPERLVVVAHEQPEHPERPERPPD
jgi:sortase A